MHRALVEPEQPAALRRRVRGERDVHSEHCGVGVEGGEQLVAARARVAAEEAVEQPVPLLTTPRAWLLPLLTTPRGGWRRCGVCGAVLLLGEGLGLGLGLG